MNMRILYLIMGLAVVGTVTAEDRINLWPVMYKQGDTLHLLGPVVKLAPDDVAVRPFFAVNTERHLRLRLLYPLAELNAGSDASWIFPFFWGEDHRVAFPIYWRYGSPYGAQRDGLHAVFPLYGYDRDGDDYTVYAPWPFVRFSREGETKSWRAWPVAGYRDAPGRTRGYALWPLAGWWTTKDGTGASGRYMAPLFYQESDAGSSRFVSLPWSQGYDAQQDEQWRASFPLFYSATRPDGATFISLPYMHHRDGTVTRWGAPPLLSWGEQGADHASWRIAAGLAGRDRSPTVNRHYVAPLYYSSETEARTLRATPLGGWITQPDGRRRWDVYPLLTWLDRREHETHFWALAPLIHYARTPEGTRHHVLPLYARDTVRGRFISPLYAAWQDGDRRSKAIPPLLARIDREGEQTDLWAGAGLFHHRFGVPPEKAQGYLVPFYYRDGVRTFYTPLYGYHNEGASAATYYATPMVGRYTGDYEGHWVWPLYRKRVHRDTGHFRDHFLLTGRRWSTAAGQGSSFWPLYRNEYKVRSHSMPVRPGGEVVDVKTQSQQVNVLLLAHNQRSQSTHASDDAVTVHTRRRHGVFPVWSHERNEAPARGVAQSRTLVLCGIYQARTAETANSEQVRRRFLWKAWDYRRADEQVQVDAFPFITYDRAGDDTRSVSFLWRVFRYQRDESGRSMDILFAPVWR